MYLMILWKAFCICQSSGDKYLPDEADMSSASNRGRQILNVTNLVIRKIFRNQNTDKDNINITKIDKKMKENRRIDSKTRH